MAAKFYSPERVFKGGGSNLINNEAVFLTDDLTDDECRLVAQIVQEDYDEANEIYGGCEYWIEVAPSAEEDPVEFGRWRLRWNKIKGDLASEKEKEPPWLEDVRALNAAAAEAAEVVRGMRSAHATAYLQWREENSKDDWQTYACINCLSLDELKLLAGLLDEEIQDSRVVDADWAIKNAAEYLSAQHSWERFDGLCKEYEALGKANLFDAEHIGEQEGDFRFYAADFAKAAISRVVALRQFVQRSDREVGDTVCEREVVEPCQKAYLQCLDGHGNWPTFGYFDDLSEHEINLMCSLLQTELERIGTKFELVRESGGPSEYIRAKLDYEDYQRGVESGNDKYEFEDAAAGALDRVMLEVKALRESNGKARPHSELVAPSKRVDETPPAQEERKRKSKADEADIKCSDFLKEHFKKDTDMPSQRTIAHAIECSAGLIPKLASYRAVKQRYDQTKAMAETKNISLSDDVVKVLVDEAAESAKKCRPDSSLRARERVPASERS